MSTAPAPQKRVRVRDDVVLQNGDWCQLVVDMLKWNDCIQLQRVNRFFRRVVAKKGGSGAIWNKLCVMLPIHPLFQAECKQSLLRGAEYARGHLSREQMQTLGESMVRRLCGDCRSVLVTEPSGYFADAMLAAFGGHWFCLECGQAPERWLIGSTEAAKTYHTTVKWLLKQGLERFDSGETGGYKLFRLRDVVRVCRAK